MNGMLNRPGRGLLVVVSAVAVACAPQPDVAADLVLRNGKVVTVDEANPEGTAIAMAGDTILAVGSDEEIAAFIGGNTQVIDLDGRLAIPGLIESHGHFLGVGDAQMQLDLIVGGTTAKQNAAPPR